MHIFHIRFNCIYCIQERQFDKYTLVLIENLYTMQTALNSQPESNDLLRDLSASRKTQRNYCERSVVLCRCHINTHCHYYLSLPSEIDECSTGQSQCQLATTNCVDTVESYRCDCKHGYRYNTWTSCTGSRESFR